MAPSLGQLITLLPVLAHFLLIAHSAEVRSQLKISPALLEQLRTSRGVELIVEMCKKSSSHINHVNMLRFSSRESQLHHADRVLREGVAVDQANIREIVGRQRRSMSQLEFKAFTTSNRVYIRGADISMVEEIASLKEVCGIREMRTYSIQGPRVFQRAAQVISEETPQWGVEMVGAHKAWESGITGKDIKVGIIDSGCNADHEALTGNFDWDYGWHDASETCDEPCDDVGHGTHVAGTVAGCNGIGVAPGALFMMCKACANMTCPEKNLLACFDLLRSPKGKDGKLDPSEAPDIINCSWGGGQADTTFDDAIETCWDMGILTVFSAGNTGPGCETIISPSDRPLTVSVGGVGMDKSVGEYSARGPTINKTMKPDISAPGTSILSAYYLRNTSYAWGTGTSMAAPHVSGIGALLLQKYPELRGRPKALTEALIKYASRDNLTVPKDCGVTNESFPNYHYGNGIAQIIT